MNTRLQKPDVVAMSPPKNDGVRTIYLPPAAPTDVPGGAVAEKQDMMHAMQEFKKYNGDTESYLTCLEREAPAGRISPVIHDRLHNDAVDLLQRNVDLFNVQVRRFKARDHGDINPGRPH